MSTSLPSKQKSPLEDLTGDCDAEGIISESDLSSMQSSMGRSGAGMYYLEFVNLDRCKQYHSKNYEPLIPYIFHLCTIM